MSLFRKHHHQWEEVGTRWYTGSDLVEGNVKGLNSQNMRFFEEMIHGVTLVNLRCKDCGALDQSKLLGRVFRNDVVQSVDEQRPTT